MPEKHQVVKVKLADIVIDGLQARTKLDQATIDDYAECIDELPPASGVFDGIKYYLPDGHHRYFAHKKAGRDEMLLSVTEGTHRDAVLLSLSANADNGLRRSREDKQKAVKVMLADSEWSAWSSRKIADACRVSHEMVNGMRGDGRGTVAVNESAHLATLPDAPEDDDPFADEDAAPSAPSAPAEVKQKASSIESAGGTPRLVERTDAKTGKTTTYAQDTSKIGKKPVDPNEPFADFNAKMREGIAALRTGGRLIAEAFDVDPSTKQIRCKWAHYYGNTTVGTIGSGGLAKLIRELERGLPFQKSPKPPGFITKEISQVKEAVVPSKAA